MRWRGWGLVLAVLAALCGLAVAGRLLDLPQDRRSFVQSTPSTAPIRLATVATLPPPAIPGRCGGRCGCPTCGTMAPARVARWRDHR
jgi:hypothetical protein